MIHIKGETSKSKVTGVERSHIQPNAVDITVDKIFAFTKPELGELSNVVVISNNQKQHRRVEQLLPIPGSDGEWADGEYWILPEGVYDCLSSSEVTIAEGEAAFVIQRSTLNRNGLRCTSGLYDSGFSGKIGFSLTVQGGPAKIYRGVALCQLLTFQAETLGLYNGSYGTGKEGEARYQ